MRLRILLSPFVVLMPLLVLSASPASAQAATCTPAPGSGSVAYPPAAGALAVGTTSVSAGQTVSVGGDGFAPNSTVTLRFDGTQVGTAQTSATCVLSATITVPSDAAPGSHTLTATGTAAAGGVRTLTATVSVLGATVTRDGTLPRTGSSSSVPAAIAGVVLVGAGSLAVIAARRRRTA